MPDTVQLESSRLECLGRGRGNPASHLEIEHFEQELLKGVTPTSPPLPQKMVATLTCSDEQRQFALTHTDEGPQLLFRDDNTDAPWQELPLADTLVEAGHHISQIACFQHHLYLALDNTISGFELWCLPVQEHSAEWQQLLKEGAYDYSNNAHVTALFSSDDRLLIATRAAQHLIDSKTRPVGPELITIERDNSWNLVVGTPRPSDEGLVVPTACLGRGFDIRDVTHISALCRSPSRYLAAISLKSAHQDQCCQLWQSSDLESWQALTLKDAPWGDRGQIIRMSNRPDGLLLYIQRFDEEGKQKTTPSDAPSIDNLPAGLELWLLHDQ